MSSVALLRSLLRRIPGPVRPLPRTGPAAVHGAPPAAPPASRRLMSTAESQVESSSWKAAAERHQQKHPLGDGFAAVEARIKAFDEQSAKLRKEFYKSFDAATRALDEQKRHMDKMRKVAKALWVVSAAIPTVGILAIDYCNRVYQP
ncbi:uncharacterized protein LOC120695837 [Panicum virgatum]|uniref:uncharacterized protein LOC120695837 n=1 Tax=Panicum virgatum TaxID=38727 RepID=UPI0019D66566|nr:uncharacterized protein LOC120695837 [Panicum virgatum]